MKKPDWNCLTSWFRPKPNGVKEMLEKIMATQKEIADGLIVLKTQVAKVAKEQSDRFDALTAEIKRLTDLINAGEATPEVVAALADVQTALQSLDDTIPDAPAT